MLYACDARWWRTYGREAAHASSELWTSHDPDAWRAMAPHRIVQYVEVVDELGVSDTPGRVHSGLNSGYQAIGLAYMWGALKIVLLGYDMQRTDRKSHWHGNHEGRLPNLGTLPDWCSRMIGLAADLRDHGIHVVNATRYTALTCFERASIEEALA